VFLVNVKVIGLDDFQQCDITAAEIIYLLTQRLYGLFQRSFGGYLINLVIDTLPGFRTVGLAAL
jgi:hypothetical protein